MEIKDILKKYNFRFNKALGQNFITDGNLLNAIAADAEVGKDDVVVEIGAGAGTLTRALAEKARYVYAFEVDRALQPVLDEVLKAVDNVTAVFSDVLKMSDEEIKNIVSGPFKVVSNLPYYITTPLMTRFLESSLPVTEMTLLMQKEVAERLTAKPGTAEYGAITVGVEAFADAAVTRMVGRNNFFPVPKVDSALLRLVIDKNKHKIDDEKFFRKTVKCAFLWRRKTLANNLKNMFSFTSQDCEKILSECNFEPMIRGEKLSVNDFILLSSAVKKYLKNR